MKTAWAKTSAGKSGSEAGFAGVKQSGPNGAVWKPRELPFTNEKLNEAGREHLSFEWNATYQSIWHVHSRGGPPSDVDRDLANMTVLPKTGQHKDPVPIYSFGPDGLWEQLS